jgi:hypothetical protein
LDDIAFENKNTVYTYNFNLKGIDGKKSSAIMNAIVEVASCKIKKFIAGIKR